MAQPSKADSAHAHDELPSFRYAMENQTGRVSESGSAKEANVDEFPVSEGIAAVSMRLRAGRRARVALARDCRRMGVHAPRPLPDYCLFAGWHARGGRFWTGRRVVFSARLSALDSSTRRRLPFYSDVRQRKVFRVRHVQPERLGRPHSGGSVGKEFRRAGSNLSIISERRSVYRSR